MMGIHESSLFFAQESDTKLVNLLYKCAKMCNAHLGTFVAQYMWYALKKCLVARKQKSALVSLISKNHFFLAKMVPICFGAKHCSENSPCHQRHCPPQLSDHHYIDAHLPNGRYIALAWFLWAAPPNWGAYLGVFRELSKTGCSWNITHLVMAIFRHYGYYNPLENPHPSNLQSLESQVVNYCSNPADSCEKLFLVLVGQ